MPAPSRFVLPLLAIGLCSAAAAEELPYAPVDAGLKVVRLDHDERESFLGIASDTEGRLFVGGREALFVYEPDAERGFAPRQELYRFPDHTWIYDIAVRGNDLYVLTVSALYLLPEARVKREDIEPRRLIWGVPLGHVHQCFHGMAIGPEGDIYFAMGDPLWYYGDFNRPDHWGHWTFFTQPEGTRVPYNGVGGVFRCKPDGSQLQVVARGLRNPCGLCFDRHWNLFSNDNDHEGLPYAYVPGRIVHITPHADFSWPRGWLLSKTPDRADLLDTMVEDLGRSVFVGQAYYDEAWLPDYRHNLLVARWCTRQVTRYPIEPHGATFKASEHVLLQCRDLARPVSVHVGRGGRIFVTISYMAHNEGSPTYPSDLVMITRQEDEAPWEFEAYDSVTATEERLVEELAGDSFADRSRAHIELGRRVPQSTLDFIGWAGEIHKHAENFARDTANGEEDAADRLTQHLLWFGPVTFGLLRAVGEDSTPLIRAEYLRAISLYEYGPNFRLSSDEVFAGPKPTLFEDASPLVQLAALQVQFRFSEPIPREVVTGPARSTDTYLRQTAAMLLAERATVEQLQFLCASDDAPGRLAGVLAVGTRLTVPPVHAEIPPELSLEEPRGPEIPFAEGTIDLRTLGRIGNYTVADHWRIGKHTDEQEALFALLLARLEDADEQVRLQAAHYLYLLNDPRSEPLVAKVRVDSDDRRLATAGLVAVNKLWTIGPFDDGGAGFDAVHVPETGPVDLAAKYDTPAGQRTWSEAATEGSPLFDFGKLARAAQPEATTDDASFYAYFRLETGLKQRINLLVGSDDGIRVWHNGQLVWTNDLERGALPTQDVLPLDLEPGSHDLLLRVRNTTGECGLYAHYRSLQPLAFVLPEKVDIAGLAERLQAAAGADAAEQLAPFLAVDWPAVVPQGDVERGRKLFESIGCAKCHAVRADTSLAGGPALSGVGRRFTLAYLVESVLAPSRQLSPVFRATGIETADGLSYTGLVTGETAEKLELLLNDGKRITLEKATIDQRQLLDLSPMPQGVVKTPDELRDVLAYLLSVE
jgi:putative heme-binding domain-containing protein